MQSLRHCAANAVHTGRFDDLTLHGACSDAVRIWGRVWGAGSACDGDGCLPHRRPKPAQRRTIHRIMTLPPFFWQRCLTTNWCHHWGTSMCHPWNRQRAALQRKRLHCGIVDRGWRLFRNGGRHPPQCLWPVRNRIFCNALFWVSGMPRVSRFHGRGRAHFPGQR